MKLRISQVIKEKGYTIEAFAKKMGISRSGLYKHIRGNPSVSMLQKIADNAGVRIIDLFQNPDDLIHGIIIYKDKVYDIDGLNSFQNLNEYINLENKFVSNNKDFKAFIIDNGNLHSFDTKENLRKFIISGEEEDIK